MYEAHRGAHRRLLAIPKWYSELRLVGKELFAWGIEALDEATCLGGIPLRKRTKHAGATCFPASHAQTPKLDVPSPLLATLWIRPQGEVQGRTNRRAQTVLERNCKVGLVGEKFFSTMVSAFYEAAGLLIIPFTQDSLHSTPKSGSNLRLQAAHHRTGSQLHLEHLGRGLSEGSLLVHPAAHDRHAADYRATTWEVAPVPFGSYLASPLLATLGIVSQDEAEWRSQWGCHAIQKLLLEIRLVREKFLPSWLDAIYEAASLVWLPLAQGAV
mmetsp:Transcript_92307/g.232169  ORF Transcript_92307/g.232169 Transcript_92307/m.232169 type:complete len:270 (+) Transcript_92307:422-1231(+)